jgi:hypothetical protein
MEAEVKPEIGLVAVDEYSLERNVSIRNWEEVLEEIETLRQFPDNYSCPPRWLLPHKHLLSLFERLMKVISYTDSIPPDKVVVDSLGNIRAVWSKYKYCEIELHHNDFNNGLGVQTDVK